MHNTGRECLRSGGVSNHAPLKVDSDIKSACGKEEYSPRQLDGWIIHLCSVEMSRGVRRSRLITPLALGLVTTFPRLFICKTWRCLGFPFVDWCALCTRLNLDLQKLRSECWVCTAEDTMKSLKENLLLGPAIKSWLRMWLIRCHFAQSRTDVFAVRIPCVDYHVEVDAWRMDLSGSLWKVWEKPVQNGDSMWCWKTIFNAQVNDASFLHPIHPDLSVLCWDCNPAVNLIQPSLRPEIFPQLSIIWWICAKVF